jgi:hypothetical protein
MGMFVKSDDSMQNDTFDNRQCHFDAIELHQTGSEMCYCSKCVRWRKMEADTIDDPDSSGNLVSLGETIGPALWF